MAEMHIVRIRGSMTAPPALIRFARVVPAPFVHKISTHITLPAPRASGSTTAAPRYLLRSSALPIAKHIPRTSEGLLCCRPHSIRKVSGRPCRISQEVEHSHQLAWAMTEQQSFGHLQDHGPCGVSNKARNDRRR